jgi:hypothetical protein
LSGKTSSPGKFWGGKYEKKIEKMNNVGSKALFNPVFISIATT